MFSAVRSKSKEAVCLLSLTIWRCRKSKLTQVTTRCPSFGQAFSQAVAQLPVFFWRWRCAFAQSWRRTALAGAAPLFTTGARATHHCVQERCATRKKREAGLVQDAVPEIDEAGLNGIRFVRFLRSLGSDSSLKMLL